MLIFYPKSLSVNFVVVPTFFFHIRPTTINALSSLPEPEETAQTMVIRQSTEFSKASRRRRGSISHYIKKKLSFRKKGKDSSSSSLSYNIQPAEEVEEQEPRRKKHRVSRDVSPVLLE